MNLSLFQAIRSKGRTDRFYVFIPLPLAAAIGFGLEAAEQIQWSLTDRNTLSVQRVSPQIMSPIVKSAKKGKSQKRK